MLTIEQEVVQAAGGDRLIAALILVDALMTDDPVTLQSGYSEENAILASSDYLNVDAQAIRAERERRMTS